MKCIIKRTSAHFDREKPHKDSKAEHYTVKNVLGEEYPRTRWWLEVRSLGALLELIKEEGRVIVDLEGETPVIEIYDDYRE